jgi:hypothetical protein
VKLMRVHGHPLPYAHGASGITDLEVKSVGVFPSRQFSQDVSLVVVSQGPRQLVVTHARAILASSPGAGDFRGLQVISMI